MEDRFLRIPDYVYLLYIMHNIGAIDPERALSVEEISHWASMKEQKVEEDLKKLIESGYAGIKADSGTKKYFVTIDGIRKVLSIYS